VAWTKDTPPLLRPDCRNMGFGDNRKIPSHRRAAVQNWRPAQSQLHFDEPGACPRAAKVPFPHANASDHVKLTFALESSRQGTAEETRLGRPARLPPSLMLAGDRSLTLAQVGQHLRQRSR
jgi:hypothetical protein